METPKKAERALIPRPQEELENEVPEVIIYQTPALTKNRHISVATPVSIAEKISHKKCVQEDCAICLSPCDDRSMKGKITKTRCSVSFFMIQQILYFIKGSKL
jgi:hypothetical protein